MRTMKEYPRSIVTVHALRDPMVARGCIICPLLTKSCVCIRFESIRPFHKCYLFTAGSLHFHYVQICFSGELQNMKSFKPDYNPSGNDRYAYLTQTPIPGLISRLAVPTIISMLVTAVYNAADTFFVGRISTQATAAVGLSFSVMALIQALAFACGQGSGSYLSRMLGAGDLTQARQMASTGFALSLILGILTAFWGNLFLDPLCRAVGATATTMPDTRIYMRIILIGAPFMMGQFVINNQLRYQGSAFYAMVGLMAGALLNIILDPVLIFVFDLGVAGAAIATVTGQFISFFVLILGSLRGGNIHPSPDDVRLNFHYLKEIVNAGIPSLFRQGMAAVATLLLNTSAGIYGGDAAIAGMSIVTRVMMFQVSALIGFGQGYQPVASFNYGAGLKKRVREGYLFCLKYGTIYLTITGILCFIFAPSILRFFRNDPAVIETGSCALRWQAAVLPLMAVIVMTNMMFQSMGLGVKASLTSSMRNGIFFIPLILILPRLLGLTGVEITQPCADLLSAGFIIPMAVMELKKLRQDEYGCE